MPSCLFQPLFRSTGCLQVQKPSAVPIEQVGLSSHPSASPETQFHWSATVPQQVFLLQKLLALFVCCCLLSSSLVIFIYLLLFQQTSGKEWREWSVQPAVFNAKSSLFIFFHYFCFLTPSLLQTPRAHSGRMHISDTEVL